MTCAWHLGMWPCDTGKAATPRKLPPWHAGRCATWVVPRRCFDSRSGLGVRGREIPEQDRFAHAFLGLDPIRPEHQPRLLPFADTDGIPAHGGRHPVQAVNPGESVFLFPIAVD